MIISASYWRAISRLTLTYGAINLSLAPSLTHAAPLTQAATDYEQQVAIDNRQFDLRLSPGPLAERISQLAALTGLNFVYSFDALAGHSSRGLYGRFTPEAALRQLLQGTGFAGEIRAGSIQLSALPEPMLPEPASMSAPVAELPAQPIDEILVQGYSYSLQQSLLQKRDNPGFVDVIHADEIGKLPAANAAEGLQRLTGVTIERNGGVGQFVTVRGFGPEFNLVQLNGRTLATDHQERGFTLDLIPNDFIDAATLAKSGSSEDSEGSLGARIDLSTPSPLALTRADNLERGRLRIRENDQTLQSAKRNADTHATPELFVLTAMQHPSADQPIAALLALSAQEDSALRQGYTSEGFRYLSEARVLNTEGTGIQKLQNIYAPRSFRIYETRDQRRQISGLASIEAEAELDNGRLQLRSDTFLSDHQSDSLTQGFQAYFEEGFKTLTLDETRTATGFTRLGQQEWARLPSPLQQALGSPQGNDHIATRQDRLTQTLQSGLSLAYEKENSHSRLDYAWSRTRNRGGGSPFSAQGFESLNTAAWQAPNTHSAAAIPSYSAGQATDSPEQVRAHFFGRFGGNNDDDLHELKLDSRLTPEAGLFTETRFGLFGQIRRKIFTSLEMPYPRNCAYCGRLQPIDAPSLALLGTDSTQFFSRFEQTDDFAGGLKGGLNPTESRSWLGYDVDKLAALLTHPAFIAINPLAADEIRARLGDDGLSATADPLASYQVDEQIAAIFGEVIYEGNIADRPFHLEAGLRALSSKTRTQGLEASIANLSKAADDDQLVIAYNKPSLQSSAHRYTNWLPSIMAYWDFSPEQKLRLGYHQSLTRPNLRDLGAKTTLIPRAGSASLNRGNPKLTPYRAQNYDAAWEWYGESQHFASLSLFYKRIHDFISTGTAITETYGIPLAESFPSNQENAWAGGLELAWQNTWSNGAGLQFNHTWVNSSARWTLPPKADTSPRFAIEGLSPRAYNAILFYKQETLALRASYTWRQSYLRALFGAQNQPEQVEDYGQLDLHGELHLTHNTHLFIDVSNALAAAQTLYSSYPSRVISYEYTGRQLWIGIRWQKS